MQAAGPCTVAVHGIHVGKLVLLVVTVDLLPKGWSIGM